MDTLQCLDVGNKRTGAHFPEGYETISQIHRFFGDRRAPTLQHVVFRPCVFRKNWKCKIYTVFILCLSGSKDKALGMIEIHISLGIALWNKVGRVHLLRFFLVNVIK